MCRYDFIAKLEKLGFECRPIVAGNFTKNPVMQHIEHEIHGVLENAEYIDQHGLFIGNHHFPVGEAAEALADLQILDM